MEQGDNWIAGRLSSVVFGRSRCRRSWAFVGIRRIAYRVCLFVYLFCLAIVPVCVRVCVLMLFGAVGDVWRCVRVLIVQIHVCVLRYLYIYIFIFFVGSFFFHPQNLQAQLAALQEDTKAKGGGRSISSVGGAAATVLYA